MSNLDYDPARYGRNWNNQMPECMKGANMLERAEAYSQSVQQEHDGKAAAPGDVRTWCCSLRKRGCDS